MSNKHPLRKMVFKESLWTLTSSLISRAGALLFTIILARFLLPEGFGLYSLALSISIIFITFADLGTNPALLRYVSLYIESNPKKAAAYYRYIFNIKIKIALISSILLLVLSYFLANFVFKIPELFLLLVVLSAYTFLISVQAFFEQLFYTKDKVKLISIKETVFQGLRIVLVLILFLLIVNGNKVLFAVLTMFISTMVALSLTLFFYKKIFNFGPSLEKVDTSGVKKFIGFMTLSSLAGVFFSYTDTIIMGLFIPVEYVGYYKASMSLAITLAGALSFPGVFLSTLTKMDKDKVQEGFNKIVRILLILVIPAAFGLAVLARYFLRFVYGPEYIQGTVILQIVSPLVVLFVLTSILLNLFAARNRTKEFSIFTTFCTILNIALDIAAIKVLLPYSEMYATIGVSAATLVSWLIYFLGGTGLMRDKMGIKFDFKLFLKPLIASAIMASLILFIQSFNQDMTLLIGILEVLLGILVYFGIMIFLKGIKKGDVIFLRDFFRRSIPVKQDIS